MATKKTKNVKNAPVLRNAEPYKNSAGVKLPSADLIIEAEQSGTVTSCRDAVTGTEYVGGGGSGGGLPEYTEDDEGKVLTVMANSAETIIVPQQTILVSSSELTQISGVDLTTLTYEDVVPVTINGNSYDCTFIETSFIQISPHLEGDYNSTSKIIITEDQFGIYDEKSDRYKTGEYSVYASVMTTDGVAPKWGLPSGGGTLYLEATINGSTVTIPASYNDVKNAIDEGSSVIIKLTSPTGVELYFYVAGIGVSNNIPQVYAFCSGLAMGGTATEVHTFIFGANSLDANLSANLA